MPQSLARLHVPLVFSTKERTPWITDAVRESLHSYIATVLADHKCHAVLINSVEDHVHALFELGRSLALSKAVEVVKASSSRWIKAQGPEFAAFAWQAGYGAFAVSESNVLAVRDYVADQRKHHEKRSLQDEYRTFLDRHGIALDERFVWD